MLQDDWRVRSRAYGERWGCGMSMSCCRCRSSRMRFWMRCSAREGRRVCFRRTGITLGREWGWRGSRLGRAGVWCGWGMGCTLDGCRVRRFGVRWWIRRWRASATHVRIVPTTVTDCPQVANQGFGYVCAYVTTPPAAVATTTSAMVFDRRFRLADGAAGELDGGARGWCGGYGECDISDES